jgi:hypothetical protein
MMAIRDVELNDADMTETDWSKLLKEIYGINYQAARHLIRLHGLDKATEIIAERAAAGGYDEKEEA